MIKEFFSKRKNRVVLYIMSLFVVAIFAMYSNLPSTTVRAYRGDGCTKVEKVGSLTVRVVDEKNNPVSDAVFSVETERFNEDGVSFIDNDSGISSSLTLGEATLSNKYLDMAGSGAYVFESENENKAVITLVQIETPEGYEMVDPIVIQYRYKDTAHPEYPYFVPPEISISSWNLRYDLDITLLIDGDGAATLAGTTVGGEYDPATEYTLTIKLVPEVEKREITISKIWDGDDQSTRSDITAFVEYELPAEPDEEAVKGRLTSEGLTWTKNDNEWSVKMSVPKNAAVTDYGEVDVPDGYVFSKGRADIDNDVYMIVNTKQEQEQKQFKITYKLNGGEYGGSGNDIVEIHDEGETISIHEAPTRNGYTFKHWEGSVYQPGDSYTVVENHTFTAIWEKIPEKPKYDIPRTGD